MRADHSGFDLPIRIDYFPPLWLLPFILITHTVAALCLIPVNLPWYSKLLLLTVVAGSLWFYYGEYRRYSDIRNPFRLVLDRNNNWSVIAPGDNSIGANLNLASILQPGFIVLHFNATDNRRYVFIFTKGNLDKQTLRRLRVRLFNPRV